MQVTRFSCGGFTFAIRLNHTMSDSSGFIQFLNTIAEFAQQPQTKITPSVPPIWQRHLLSARQPPSITCPHFEFDQALAGAATATTTANETTTIDRSFFLGPKEIRAIRNRLPHHHYSTTATTFELLTACIWQCRTRALCLAPDETVRLSFTVNGRGNKHGLNLSPGYYGNVFTYPAVMAKAGMLSMLPLGYALQLVKKAKAQVSEEYFRSVADLMVIKGRPSHTLEANKDYIISDNTRGGFDKLDFGWGKLVYGGIARAISLISFYVPFRDIRGGEDGIVLPICLPESVMDRFEQELKKMTQEPVEHPPNHKPISMHQKCSQSIS
ncbi:methanol O-anthraniloyltransferase-like [Camellia sinensis]|nr:methanol O-anthraniloyltransferase-like [Camellia sinensis]